MGTETEAKIALQPDEIGLVRARLLEMGARPGPVDDERNLVFNLRGMGTRLGRRRIRLRMFAGRADALLTSKGPALKKSGYKSREEVEVRVSDAESARQLLEHLGFRAKAQYDKHREHWYFNDTTIALDRLAFGDFLEVEGEEHAITATLIALGLGARAHERSGYTRLMKKSAKSSLRKSPRSVTTTERAGAPV
jgi:adenylate cyclase, class 2